MKKLNASWTVLSVLKYQVSLWGGDAVFSKLDLRLDVVEEELALPFSFVNGHIHELRIHVPWTKLISEPIVITINTIECILKLRDGSIESSECSSSTHSEACEGDSSTSRASPEPAARKKSRRQEVEAPTSYIQSIISRIINNVTILCNNVILKYVEDDIVLSINVKTLELKTVNGQWQPAFVDLGSEDRTLRRLGTLTDLTVCLDRRSASGKIDNYQEPLLYRCSLSLRIVQQYGAAGGSSVPISVKYHLYSPLLHFSLSDTQLPMFARLVSLVLALSNSDLEIKESPADTSVKRKLPKNDAVTSGPRNSPTVTPPVAGSSPPETSTALPSDTPWAGDEEDSWSSWAWSLGSALLPIYWEDEEEDGDGPHRTEQEARMIYKMKRSLEFGLYVETATWVFKVTESSQDVGYFGPTRMRFRPFLRAVQRGSFVTVKLQGVSNTHAQVGVAEVMVEPMGDTCLCGITERLSPEEEENGSRGASPAPGARSEASSSGMGGGCGESDSSSPYLVCGEHSEGYLNGSLFLDEESRPGREDQGEDAVGEEPLARTAAVALDFKYCLHVSEEVTPEQLARLFANLEYSDLEETSVCRVSVGACTALYSSGAHHRLSAILAALAAYDYTPYGSDLLCGTAAAHEQPSDHDLTVVTGSSLPSVMLQLSVRAPSLVLRPAHHPHGSSTATPLHPSRRKRSERIVVLEEDDDCVVVAGAHRMELEWQQPMYKRRAALTAASVATGALPASRQKWELVMLAARANISVKVTQGSMWVCDAQTGSGACVVRGCSIGLQHSWLLLPHLHPSTASPLYRSSLTGSVVVSISASQLLLLSRVMASWTSLQQRHRDTVLSDATADKYPVICLKISNLAVDVSSSTQCCSAVISLVNATVSLKEPLRPVRVTRTSSDSPPHDGDPSVKSSSASMHASLSELGSVVLKTDNHINSRTICLVSSGLESRGGLETFRSQTEAANEQLLRVTVSWPYDLKDETSSIIFALGVQKSSLLVDPSLMDFLTYCPRKAPCRRSYERMVSKRVSEVRSSSHRRTSGGSASETGTTRRGESSTTSEVQTSRAALSLVTRPPPQLSTISTSAADATWKHVVSKWCSLLQRLLVHIDVHSCTLFVASSPLNIRCDTALSNAVHRTYLTRGDRVALSDTLVLVLPHISLRNSACKTGLLDSIIRLPVMPPDECKAPGFSALPWSACLQDFSVYSLQGTGSHVRLPILKSVNTTATISIVTKQSKTGSRKTFKAPDVDAKTSPVDNSSGALREPCSATPPPAAETDVQVSNSIVVHADMSPVRVCGCRRQVVSHVALVESFLRSAVLIRENYLSYSVGEPLSSVTVSKDSVPSLATQAPVTTGTSVDIRPALPPKTEQSGASLSAWMQWTVAKVSATLYAEQELWTEQHTQIRTSGRTPTRSSSGPAAAAHLQSLHLSQVSGSLSGQVLKTADASGVETSQTPNAWSSTANVLGDSPINKVVDSQSNEEPDVVRSSELEGSKRGSDSKREVPGVQTRLRAELEDLTMAVDLQQVYTKIKCRITAFSVLHSKHLNNTWMPGDKSGVVVAAYPNDSLHQNIPIFCPEKKSCESPVSERSHDPQEADAEDEPPSVQPSPAAKQHHGFLAFTLTSAVCKNVHGRWNQLLSREHQAERIPGDVPNNTLTEVDVKVQPLDLILMPAALKPFTHVYEPWLHLKLPPNLATAFEDTSSPSDDAQLEGDDSSSAITRPAKEALGLNSRSLPLLYVHLEGVRLILPAPVLDVGLTCGHDVVVLQLASLLISPQVENPVERTIVRRDMWKLAEQARILSLPGSALEDRQYQLDLVSIAVSTGV
ncbi:Vacuolar protein sorting-associated protein 13 second N-terminal domain [Trinorchestia longiramus]|nr:Vacuolar protein sorting-associated protein 13 second N-terminal domain [Trinorchestia longiramus]